MTDYLFIDYPVHGYTISTMSLSCFHAVKRSSTNNQRPKPIVSFVDAVFLGDRSGSMESMGEAPMVGAVEFMNKYKDFSRNNSNHTFTNVEFVSFDDEPIISFSGDATLIDNKYLNIVKRNMIPRNCTRLYDTAIDTIKRQQERIDIYYSSLPREVQLLCPSIAVSFTLLTDGEDNMSYYSAIDLNMHITNHKNNYKAVCFFAAANQDAISIGNKYGFSRDTSLQMGSDETQARSAFRACTESSLRCASQECTSYTQSERETSYNYAGEDNYIGEEDYNTDDDYNGGGAQRACGGYDYQEYQEYQDLSDIE